MNQFVSRKLSALFFGVALSSIAPAPVRAEEDGVATTIAARLTDWADAFNARDAAHICDLFSADLISTMRGRPDEGRGALCARLAKTLANRRLSIRYAPHIKEVIVSGDLAVVRLEWSATTRIGAAATFSHEPGIDVFRREVDGKWRIIRFLAFSTTRN